MEASFGRWSQKSSMKWSIQTIWNHDPWDDLCLSNPLCLTSIFNEIFCESTQTFLLVSVFNSSFTFNALLNCNIFDAYSLFKWWNSLVCEKPIFFWQFLLHFLAQISTILHMFCEYSLNFEARKCLTFLNSILMAKHANFFFQQKTNTKIGKIVLHYTNKTHIKKNKDCTNKS